MTRDARAGPISRLIYLQAKASRLREKQTPSSLEGLQALLPAAVSHIQKNLLFGTAFAKVKVLH